MQVITVPMIHRRSHRVVPTSAHHDGHGTQPQEMLQMGLDNPIHIAFLLILLLLVFGAKRLPEMGKSLGAGMRGFKDSLSGEGLQSTLTTQQTVTPQQHVAPVASAPAAAAPAAVAAAVLTPVADPGTPAA